MSDQAEDDSSKTEEPSEKRLRDAREKGDVPSSRETANLTGTFALFVLVTWLAPTLLPDIAGLLGGVFSLAGDFQIGSGDSGLQDLRLVTGNYLSLLLPLLGSMALLMIVAAVFGILIQGETVVSTERIKPKLSNLSPASGLKRIYGTQALVEFLKNLVKLAVVSIIALSVARLALERVLPGSVVAPETLSEHLRRDAGRMLIAVCCFLAPIAIFDIAWKRFQWIKKNRMTPKEVKDEHKESEGSPEIKRRRNTIRHEKSKNQISKTVPKATVVLTNPTHYAVVLRYDRATDPAPVCTAKGTDLMAAQIRQLAREHNVPVIENRPLARALYAEAEVDQVIPSDHWQAVAQIIAYVIDLKNRIHRTPPPGAHIREED